MRTYINVLKKLSTVAFNYKLSTAVAIIELLVNVLVMAQALKNGSVWALFPITYLAGEIFLLRSKSVTPAMLLLRIVVALIALKGFRFLEMEAGRKRCFPKTSIIKFATNVSFERQIVEDKMFCGTFYILCNEFFLNDQSGRYDKAYNIYHLLKIFGRGDSIFPYGGVKDVKKLYRQCHHLIEFYNDETILQAIAIFKEQGNKVDMMALQNRRNGNMVIDCKTGQEIYDPKKPFIPDYCQKINDHKMLHQLLLIAILNNVMTELSQKLEKNNKNDLSDFIKKTNSLFKELDWFQLNVSLINGKEIVRLSGPNWIKVKSIEVV